MNARQKPYYYRPIGYWEADRALKDIEKYRFLMGWSRTNSVRETDVIELSERVRKYSNENHFESVSREMSRMGIVMHRCFERIGLGTRVHWTTSERKYDFEKNIPTFIERKRSTGIFVSDGTNRPIDDYRLSKWLDEAEGFYDRIKQRRKRQMVNPVYLISLIFRIPLSILEHAGLDTDDESIKKFVFWMMQALMAILLLLIVTKLGISIDFSDLFKLKI